MSSCQLVLHSKTGGKEGGSKGGKKVKWYSSEGNGSLAVGSQGIPRSHTTQQTSHKSFIGKDTRGWLPLLWQEAAGGRAEGRLYIGFGGGRGFQELSRMGIGEISS